MSTAGYMINSAFDDWSKHPVITTLDSIAAPIKDIQFPTVTACLDQPPDNWAFLENVLDSLAFDCEQEDYVASKFEHCNDTDDLRNDFKFLVEALAAIYHQLPYEFGKSTIPKGLFAYYDHYGTDENVNLNGLLKFIKNITADGNISSLQLREMVVDSFSKGLISSNIYEMLGGDGNLKTFNSNACGETCMMGAECKNVFLIKLIHEFTSTKQSFGSVVRNYMHLDSESFSSTNTHQDIEDKFSMRQYDDFCKVLSKNEKMMHEYLTNISKLVGFNESELISSFDIPGIFGNSKNLNEASWPPLMPQTFLYSKCKEHYEGKDFSSIFKPGISQSNLEFTESCINKWSLIFGSLGQPLTANGEPCLDECGYRGENYTWCNTRSSWSYCDLGIQYKLYDGMYLK